MDLEAVNIQVLSASKNAVRRVVGLCLALRIVLKCYLAATNVLLTAVTSVQLQTSVLRA